ncbi:alkanesulfonate monooxygenase [Seinonella peptonophila]|uniref:Alkanesulfonate monooxygenase n=1 Tax=Seinonella peptonophila TaxID=112248 RepID=A0A1M4U9W4_9BACL|nr:alkanesulfonate monooxygenase [Seinonella peptonophila]
MEVLYWLPTLGDSRYFGADKRNNNTNLEYLEQVAKTVDSLGYDGMYLGTGSYCDDPWVTASSLIHSTQKSKFLIALRPSVISPFTAARMAATFHRISESRIALNIVSGASPEELAKDGVFLSHDQRYEYTGEFLEVFKALLGGKKVNFQGQYIRAEEAQLLFPPQPSHPEIFCVGASDVGQSVAAKYGDIYLTFGEPYNETKELFKSVRKKAQKYNRNVRFALGLYIIVREKEEDAWEAANELIKHIRIEDIKQFNQILSTKFDSQGRNRQTKIMEENASLMIDDHLWAGTSLVNIGPFAVVGNPDSVMESLHRYVEMGTEIFAIVGIPHLEESYRIAELVLPKLRKKFG